eukprot:1141334-Pelagomonas_calceolata.AAC.4
MPACPSLKAGWCAVYEAGGCIDDQGQLKAYRCVCMCCSYVSGTCAHVRAVNKGGCSLYFAIDDGASAGFSSFMLFLHNYARWAPLLHVLTL